MFICFLKISYFKLLLLHISVLIWFHTILLYSFVKFYSSSWLFEYPKTLYFKLLAWPVPKELVKVYFALWGVNT